jgi:hypothetical protein
MTLTEISVLAAEALAESAQRLTLGQHEEAVPYALVSLAASTYLSSIIESGYAPMPGRT